MLSAALPGSKAASTSQYLFKSSAPNLWTATVRLCFRFLCLISALGLNLHQCFEERVQFEHGSGDLSLLWLEMPVVQQVQCFLHTNLPDVAVKGII